jgi:hypothetical protein
MNIMNRYRNGNCEVTLYDDGTKTRNWDGEPEPEFPESIDLKITNCCAEGCPWCHESATPEGEHADVQWILDTLEGLPPGVEIAIGGGDPLCYPHMELYRMFECLHKRGLVLNVTVNNYHLLVHNSIIADFKQRGWLTALGISGDPKPAITSQLLPAAYDDNTVLHYVAGIDDVQAAIRAKFKVLVLGYKRHGRGKDYRDVNLEPWRYFTADLLSGNRKEHGTAFDNLALEQLNIRSYVPRGLWLDRYMGDDGEFTMYVDAVSRAYAKSSTSQPRIFLEGMSIREAFSDIRAGRAV